MNQTLTLAAAFIATIISTLIITSTRAFPFVLFSRKDPPAIIRFIEKYIPSMIMAILLVYCLKDVQFSKAPFSIPELSALALTIILHLWKHNPLVSIFGGTIFYMFLGKMLHVL